MNNICDKKRELLMKKFLIVLLFISVSGFCNCKYSGDLKNDTDAANEMREGITLSASEYVRLYNIKKKENIHKKTMKSLKKKYLKYKVILKLLDQRISKYNDCAWRL